MENQEKIIKAANIYMREITDKFSNLSSNYQEYLNESVEEIQESLEMLEQEEIEIDELVQNIQKLERMANYYKINAQNDAATNGEAEEDAIELQGIWENVCKFKEEVEELMDEDDEDDDGEDDYAGEDFLNLTNNRQNRDDDIRDVPQRRSDYGRDDYSNKKVIASEFAEMDISKTPESHVHDLQPMKPVPVDKQPENYKFSENIDDEIKEIRESAYDDFIERHKEILEILKNQKLEVNPETLTNITTEMEAVKKELASLKALHVETINDMLKDSSDVIKATITSAVEEGKITAELDKRSKTFITAGGIASFVFCLFVIVMGIFGNKYIQDALRYQNLMEVFNVMPTEQYNQIQGWVQTSYQEINPGKTNTPIPAK